MKHSELKTVNHLDQLYLDLLKNCLTRANFPEKYKPLRNPKSFYQRSILTLVKRVIASWGLDLVRTFDFDAQVRSIGRDWPTEGETMIGTVRLNNIESSIKTILQDQVPGDLIETGVWRGGATIFMRAVLKVYGEQSRNVWVADSFCGLPKPDPVKYPVDTGDTHWISADSLAVSLEQVRANFAKYDLLDDKVKFIEGWFEDTLPTVPIRRLALLRLDGDMYQSTMVALNNLYSRVSKGGFVIIDDYALPGCRTAVDDFRAANNIKDEMHEIDWTGRYWRRS